MGKMETNSKEKKEVTRLIETNTYMEGLTLLFLGQWG